MKVQRNIDHEDLERRADLVKLIPHLTATAGVIIGCLFGMLSLLIEIRDAILDWRNDK